MNWKLFFVVKNYTRLFYLLLCLLFIENLENQEQKAKRATGILPTLLLLSHMEILSWKAKWVMKSTSSQRKVRWVVWWWVLLVLHCFAKYTFPSLGRLWLQEIIKLNKSNSRKKIGLRLFIINQLHKQYTKWDQNAVI